MSDPKQNTRTIRVEEEEWRGIPGFSTWEASSLGRFRRSGVERIPFNGKKGRRYLELREPGSKARGTAASFILLAFVGPRPPGYFAVHLDDNLENERLDNLAWAPPAENYRQAIANNRMKRGNENGASKLTAELVRTIRSSVAAGYPKKTLARELGISHNSLVDVVKRRTWGHVSNDAGGLGVWASADHHERDMAPAATRRQRCFHCPPDALNKRHAATHIGRANGVALMSGCEWSVRQWVRNPNWRLAK